MTRLNKMTAIAISTLCIPVYAMGDIMTNMDVNGDGLVSFGEVQAIYPELTGDQFSAMDLNADGALDNSELAAAQEAGMMPATPSEG